MSLHAGDIDGDGGLEAMIGAPGSMDYDDDMDGPGAVYVFHLAGLMDGGGFGAGDADLHIRGDGRTMLSSAARSRARTSPATAQSSSSWRRPATTRKTVESASSASENGGVTACIRWLVILPLLLGAVPWERPHTPVVDPAALGVTGLKASDCSTCHTEVASEWSTSTRAAAWVDPQFQAELHKDPEVGWLCLSATPRSRTSSLLS